MRERERERDNASMGGTEGDTETEVGSKLRAVSTEPDAGLKRIMDPRAYNLVTFKYNKRSQQRNKNVLFTLY